MTVLPRQCAVLVGGKGTRLGHLTASTSKPLLDCGGRPFLTWIIRELSRFGVEEVVLLAGHLFQHLQSFTTELPIQLPKPVTVKISCEPSPAGTGGAIWHARDFLDERFLLVNGDSWFDTNLTRFIAQAPPNGLAHILLARVDDASRYGIVQLAGSRIVAFHERPQRRTSGTINAGVYLLQKKIVEFLKPACSIEKDVLPQLADTGHLTGTAAEGYFIDIGIPADYARAAAEIPQRLRRPAVFFDRDGVLNEDLGWVGSVDRFRWVLGAKNAVLAATDAGFHAFVVTNQAGVARGHYSERDVAALHNWMIEELRAAGGTIDDIRFCPIHPDATILQYRGVSEHRKPRPGMIIDLSQKWEIKAKESFLIGDKESDLQAASAAGIRGYQYAGGDLSAFLNQHLPSK